MMLVFAEDPGSGLVTAAISAGVSIIVAAGGVFASLRVARVTIEAENRRHHEDKLAASTRVITRFREPLIQAASHLQSRLFNILRKGFLEAYLLRGSATDKDYARTNTAYVIAQYFAWTEILRQEVQFLDLGTVTQNRRLNELLDKILSEWQTDSYPAAFRVWAGEQRAIGERMISSGRCVGYADFVDIVNGDPSRLPGIVSIIGSVNTLATSDAGKDRLTAIQHSLVDLLSFLDPDCVRVPEGQRQKA